MCVCVRFLQTRKGVVVPLPLLKSDIDTSHTRKFLVHPLNIQEILVLHLLMPYAHVCYQNDDDKQSIYLYTTRSLIKPHSIIKFLNI